MIGTVQIKFFVTLVEGLVFLGAVGAAFADNGTSDPDFDYLPPEEKSFFQSMSTYARSWFRQPSHAGTFETAKRRMYDRLGDEESLYCGCATRLADRDFDRESCQYIPVNDNIRANRLEAEHIVPAYWIAHFHEGENCWVKDEETCGDARECCLANDPRFKRAHNDLINLSPAIGELNNVRSNLTYDVIRGEPRLYGACDFEADTGLRVTEPREEIRGDIARVYFYMRDTYNLTLPEDLAELMSTWNQSDPVDQREQERNDLIQEIQGSSNPYIAD